MKSNLKLCLWLTVLCCLWPGINLSSSSGSGAGEIPKYLSALESETGLSEARAYFQTEDSKIVVPALAGALEGAVRSGKSTNFQKELVMLLLYHKQGLDSSAHELIKQFESDPYLGKYVSQMLSKKPLRTGILPLRKELQNSSKAARAIAYHRQLDQSAMIVAASTFENLRLILSDSGNPRSVRAEAATEILLTTTPLALIKMYETIDVAGKVAVLQTFHKAGFATGCEVFMSVPEKAQIQEFLLGRFEKDPELLWPEIIRSLYCFVFTETPYTEQQIWHVNTVVRDKILRVQKVSLNAEVQNRSREIINLMAAGR